MKTRIAVIFPAGSLLFLAVSCSPSTNQIATEVYGTVSAWAAASEYTDNPTYTLPPTMVREITRIVAITETDTPTSIHSATFTPTKTPPTILISGIGILKTIPNEERIPMSYFDLDTGENGDEKASDLAFWESCGTGCFPGISLLHGAEGFIFGHREPSYQDCAEIMFSEFEYEFYSYQYICIRTNSDNIAMFKIMLDCDSDADGTHTLTFIYTTWKSAGK